MADVDIEYSLDPSGYLVGVNQIDAANQKLASSMSGVVSSTTALSKAIAVVTPGRAVQQQMLGYAQAAAKTEQELASLAATSVTTGANFGKLQGSVKAMARDLPVGFSGARQLTEQFTRMGVGAAGSEEKIAKLATASAKLGGATGENMGQLAQGMAELSRATGNNNLDPKRFEALGDSLTTISAKSGASATSILSFSKAIAPMASNAGIGSTGILGISSAFSKLGEDGLVAANTVNKMLTDMNRSVREGTPEMRTYAQFTGKTVGEFEKLFKQNPAEALTQVTEAIAKAGPGGPRMLEQLGIEGVRGQRALQAVSASGGLRPAIAEATAAYGSKSTEEAAAKAFGGLNDSLSELEETTKQLGEAMGAPLLKPLTMFTNVLKGVTGMAAGAAGSGFGQTIISLGLAATALLGGAKLLTTGLGMLGLGRQAVTSGPAKSIIGGFLTGGQRYGGKGEKFSEDAINLGEAGKLGPASQRLFDLAKGAGEIFRKPFGPQPEKEGFTASLKKNIQTYGHGVTQMYFESMGQSMKNARVPFPERSSAFGLGPTFQKGFDAAEARIAQGGFKETIGGLKDFHAAVKGAAGSTAAFGETSKVVAKSMLESVKLGAQTVKDIAVPAGKGIGKGIGKLASAMGPELAVSAGVGLYSMGYGNLSGREDRTKDFLDSDIRSSINMYRESIGKATTSTQTFAELNESVNKNLAKTASGMSFESVKAVTEEDKTAAATSKGKILEQYQGTPEEIAGQIVAKSPQGIASDELQAIKVDLLRQFGSGTVESIMKALPAGLAEGSATPLSQEDITNNLVKAVGGASQTGGLQGAINAITIPTGQGPGNMGDLETTSHLPKWMRAPLTGAGGGLHHEDLTDAARAQIENVQKGIAQTFSEDVTKFGGAYADQEQQKKIKSTAEALYNSGNADALNMFLQGVGGAMDPKLKDKIWSPSELKSKGFDVYELMGGDSDVIASRLNDLKEAQKKSPTGQIEKELKVQPYVADIMGGSQFFGQAFDPRRTSPASQAVAAAIDVPSVENTTDAVNKLTASAKTSGTGLDELALQATEAAKKVGATGTERQIMLATRARLEEEMGRQQANMAPGAAAAAQFDYASRQAAIKPKTPEEEADQKRYADAAKAISEQGRAQMVQRLMMQRQYDIGRGRAREDYTEQRGYARDDYNTQRARTQRNFNTSMERMGEDYNKNVARAEEDFATQRMRTLRDYHIGAARAEQDYQTGRARQIRDFNKNLARQIEDAAAQMYDPYSRIQTKATWDAKNLMVNMAEQTEAMNKQKQQLDELRKMGLSAQTIDILGLGKTENAQQLNNLFADAGQSPEIIAQLNQSAKDRAAAASGLYTDDSNKDLKRSREDLAQSQKDAEEDYRKSVKRSAEDLAKSMKDSADDFHKTLTRNAVDYRTTIRRAREDLDRGLKDMETDFGKSMARQETAFKKQMSRMAKDIKEADLVVAGNMTDLTTQVGKALNGQAVDWTNILTNNTSAWVKTMQDNVLPKIEDVYAGTGVVFAAGGGSGPAGSANAAEASMSLAGTGSAGSANAAEAHAAGGQVGGASPHPMADDKLIRATSGEYVQSVDAVKHYGVNTMDALNQKKIPLELVNGYADGGLVEFGRWLQKKGYQVGEHPMFGGVHPVHTPGSWHYNKSGPGGGGAIDVNHDQGSEKKFIDAVVGLAGGYGLRTIWQVSGHFDHAHFDIGKGPDMLGKAVAALAGSRTGGGNLGGGFMSFDQLTKGVDKSRGGMYGKLRDAWSKKFKAAYPHGLPLPGELGADIFRGDTGAHGAGAKANQETARKMLGQFGFGAREMGALVKLWNGESGWNEFADNPSSDAYGIPQSLPGSKMRSAGADWRVNPATQIKWGLGYIKDRYKSPGKAWAFWNRQSPHWYDQGGWMEPGAGGHVNATGRPEAVLNGDQWSTLSKLAAEGAVSLEDSRGIKAAAGSHVTVNNNQHYVYDSRNDFGGADITVLSQDPDDMARKLEAKVVASRLTETRGVRRNAR